MERLPTEMWLEITKTFDTKSLVNLSRTIGKNNEDVTNAVIMALRQRCRKYGIDIDLPSNEITSRLTFAERIMELFYPHNNLRNIFTICGFDNVWKYREILRPILKSGDINVPIQIEDDQGSTLIYASFIKDFELVYILLLLGADVNAVTLEYKHDMITINSEYDKKLDPQITALAISAGINLFKEYENEWDDDFWTGYEIIADHEPDIVADITRYLNLPVSPDRNVNLDAIANYQDGDSMPLEYPWGVIDPPNPPFHN